MQGAAVRVDLRIEISTDESGLLFIPHQELERCSRPLLILVEGKEDEKRLLSAYFVDYVTGKECLTFQLRQIGSIHGSVVAPDGGPIEGARGSALMDVGALTCHSSHPVGRPVETDDQGRFRLEGIYPDTLYRLRITRPGRECKTTDWIAVRTLERSKVAIVLRAAPGWIAGRVVDEQGRAVEGETVFLGHPCIPDATCTTDAQGRFRIEDLVPGEEVSLCIRGNH
jgi:hypothetical protein